MKSKRFEFWLFGIDTVVDLSHKGVVAFLKKSKKVSNKILRKFKQKQKSRKETREKNKDFIQKGKEQDLMLDFETFQQKQRELKPKLTYKERLSQLPNEHPSKNKEQNYEPEQ